MNISGNFNTAEREISTVKYILHSQRIAYMSVEKDPDRDASDVIITLPSGRKVTVEVKEEKLPRFKIYGDLGIDYYSVFTFIDGKEGKWKGRPQKVNISDFLADIDTAKKIKKGKVFYSKADLWLFFVVSEDNNLIYYVFLDGNKVVSDSFRNYIEKNCQFVANHKPEWQQSYSDTYESAVFYLNKNDPKINALQIDLKDYLK